MGGRILIVEDDAAINDVVCTRLRKDGHDVSAAFSGTEARLLLESRPFDLVITDLMLPGMAGEDVVRLVRSRSEQLPILVVSARDAAADKVDLLRLGADDYLTKPFDLDELAARVLVQLRHGANACQPPTPSAAAGASLPNQLEATIIHLGEWTIDPAARTFASAGAPITLTRTEFAIAELLASHPGRVFTKQALYEHAWGEPYAAQESTVSAHVSNLRAKLKPTGTDGYIQTVWGIGFRASVPAPPVS